ncbi:MAG: hypothetical protein RLZZ15_2291, partial [Verrucomicrobiota bacterium]
DRVFVGYRGHTPAEIRDNKFTVFDLATLAFTAPAALRDDGWKIAACPVNGPAADALGSALAVAWFTAADAQSRVFARYTSDATRDLGPAIRLDLGRPIGRIDTLMLADQSALFLWMEIGTAENAAGLYARRLFSDGKLSGARLVADTTQARASGFPRAALRADGRVFVSWTRPGEHSQVRLCEIDPTALVVASTVFAPPRRAAPPSLEFCDATAVAVSLAQVPR